MEDAEHEAFKWLSFSDPVKTYKSALQFGLKCFRDSRMWRVYPMPSLALLLYSNVVQRKKSMPRILLP